MKDVQGRGVRDQGPVSRGQCPGGRGQGAGWRRGAWTALIVLGLLTCFAPAVVRAQMPDPRMMHGQAIPAGELPAGTVTVRVVRETLANNVPGIDVELHGAGDMRRATTGLDGRAEFTGLPAGARVHVRAVVGGEPLQSVPFAVPAQGGMRTILVAGVSTAPAAPLAGARGLHFGNNTRFAVEFQDDTLTVFYLLEIVNDTGAPAPLDSALIIDLPTGAIGASLFEGASPLANARGPRITVAGPIPPGITEVPIAYRLENWGERLTIEQLLPLPVDQLALAVHRLPGMGLESPQIASSREASLRGQSFLVASGPALAAGTPLTFTLTGLPHRSMTGRYLAIGLAAAIALAGIWLSVSPGAAADRPSLEARRAAGLQALADLESAHRAGAVEGDAYDERRAALVAELEAIYQALDTAAPAAAGARELPV